MKVMVWHRIGTELLAAAAWHLKSLKTSLSTKVRVSAATWMVSTIHSCHRCDITCTDHIRKAEWDVHEAPYNIRKFSCCHTLVQQRRWLRRGGCPKIRLAAICMSIYIQTSSYFRYTSILMAAWPIHMSLLSNLPDIIWWPHSAFATNFGCWDRQNQ